MGRFHICPNAAARESGADMESAPTGCIHNGMRVKIDKGLSKCVLFDSFFLCVFLCIFHYFFVLFLIKLTKICLYIKLNLQLSKSTPFDTSQPIYNRPKSLRTPSVTAVTPPSAKREARSFARSKAPLLAEGGDGAAVGGS